MRTPPPLSPRFNPCFPPSPSVLRQDQEEEEPLRHRHLRGGDGGGRVPPHGQVPQLLQPQVGRGAAPVRSHSLPLFSLFVCLFWVGEVGFFVFILKVLTHRERIHKANIGMFLFFFSNLLKQWHRAHRQQMFEGIFFFFFFTPASF